MKILVCIPVIRPDKAKKLADEITGYGFSNVNVARVEDTERQGCPKILNFIVNAYKEDYGAFLFLGDDTRINSQTIPAAVAALATLPNGEGVVGLNDGTENQLTGHFLVTRWFIDNVNNGEFFHEGYRHCFCDLDLILTAKLAGLYAYAEKATVIHDNPIVTGPSSNWRENLANCDDKDLKNAYRHYAEDEKLFEKRKADRTKLKRVGICIPTNDMVHMDFAMSLARLTALCLPYGIQPVIINQKTSNIAQGRQQLMDLAIKLDVSHVLCLDSDMVFPQHLLLRLMQHDVDFVCLDAPRRRPPFTTVLLGMDGKILDHSKDYKASPLVEIKGISLALALLKTSILAKLEVPYFLSPHLKGDRFQGEDRYFGDRLRESGVKCFCDMPMSKEISHIGTQSYSITK